MYAVIEPTGTKEWHGNVRLRILGQGWTENELWFNPENAWDELS